MELIDIQLNLDEKKEHIVNAYRASFDKVSAYEKCGIPDNEISILEEDEEFQSRLKFYLILEQERILHRLRELSESDNEMIALKSILELGKIMNPEFFIENKIKEPENKNFGVVINTNELNVNRKDHASEVLNILQGAGVFKPSSRDIIKSKVN